MKQSGFNPKARWDRFIPETSESADISAPKQRIEVCAWFRNGKIYPQGFIWNNKEYNIKEITYTWQERIGRETISCFSINTGSDLYQISFNNTSYSWQLDKIIS
jgi:hypothetical protein